MKKIIAMIGAVCLILTSCSAVNDKPAESTGEANVTTAAEETVSENKQTEAETAAASEAAETSETTEASEEPDDAPDEDADGTVFDTLLEDQLFYAKQLMGALDYIDRIGGGNIPKDEETTVEIDGRQYQRVQAQFGNTLDLDSFLHENLTENLIQSRYSGILGGDEPYYIDVDGQLYGYVTAKGCGYIWIMENEEPVVEITESADEHYTAAAKFDNYGGEDEMELHIVFEDGLWKIDSISYDGMTF
ncbi:MAG: hypothetical protein ACI4JK_01975 [Oscillospiraceae bacterium]